MKLIAINGLTLTITNALSGNAVIQTSPSTVSKINGSGIYRGPLTINVTGFEDATISSGMEQVYYSLHLNHLKLMV